MRARFGTAFTLVATSLSLCFACGGPEPAASAPSGAAAATAQSEAAAVTSATGPTGATGPSAAQGATGASGALGATGQGEGDPLAALAQLAPLGVASCDAYVEAYRKCITFTVPESEKAQHARTLLHEHENWARTHAGAPKVAASALEIGCKGAQAQAAQKTRSLNCAW